MVRFQLRFIALLMMPPDFF